MFSTRSPFASASSLKRQKAPLKPRFFRDRATVEAEATFVSRILTLELRDEVFDTLERQAEVVGTSVAALVARSLERRYGPTPRAERTEAEKQAARERFRRHAGAVNLGYATGADNESIDADLAREYADTHEEAG